jgi:hypothetical protein
MKSENWNMCGQSIEVTDKFNDLGITSEYTGGCNEDKALLKARVIRH